MPLALASLLRTFGRGARRVSPRARGAHLRLESLEARDVPAVFTVTNLADTGDGSLRAALLAANATPGADTIQFGVAGSIQLTSAALPAVAGAVTIDGTTAPGFTGAPVVEVDANRFEGLRFARGSSDSTLQSLALVDAFGAGVTLDAARVRLFGNYVGLSLGGAAAGNGGSGLLINPTSLNNFIGGTGANQRNVLSANVEDGIRVVGSSRNQIVNNFIGTDPTGTQDFGNGNNGVLCISGARDNVLGGVTPLVIAPPSGGNATKPADGNLISGNGNNGVLITNGSADNTLAGNFVGTTLTGNAALGNSLDGVAIVARSHGNKLLGTTASQQPFVYYNVVSGNGGNGLRVRDSNGTTVHANFFGLGANNATGLGNSLNGVLVEGSSANTTFGGPIPLGNVTAANGRNGVEVKDTASGFVSFNTFSGMAAFNPAAVVGNAQDGILITSTGRGIVLRTNQFSGNGDDGVDIAGDARGVQVAKNYIGVTTNGLAAQPNGDNGVEIRGNASLIVVGGQERSVSPFNIISGNTNNGVAILENARQNVVTNSLIGTQSNGVNAVPNGGAGVLLGGNSRGNTIGGGQLQYRNIISGNAGCGVLMTGATRNNRVVGNRIGVNIAQQALANGGDGVTIDGGVNNSIGTGQAGAKNVISYNTGAGVRVLAGTGNRILSNSISSNGALGIDLAAGANSGATAPVITSLRPVPGGVRIAGTLAGAANSQYRVEIFSDFLSDPSGFGQGRFLVAVVTVTTDAAGAGTFRVVRSLPVDGGLFYSATATDAQGNTSEFSNALDITTSLGL